MILVVTINPLLEHRLTYTEIRPGNTHRNPDEVYQAGGKGINVSRQLNHLDIKNMSLTLLGGRNGKHLDELLHNEKINFSHLKINDNTRTSVVVNDLQKQFATTYFGKNNSVTDSEADEFIRKLEKAIVNCEMVVFSGSSPCKEADKIFPAGIEIANKLDKISVVDTYGKHLEHCINCSPTIIHNNVDEIESSFGIKIQSEEEILIFLDELYSKGIKQSFITNGTKDTYASNFEFHYKVENPTLTSVDSTGSGDAFVAGIIYSWHYSHTFIDTLSFASALGAVNSTRFDVCNVNKEEAEDIISKFRVSSVGKKLKLIDDRPH